jgi:hypothetical protein
MLIQRLQQIALSVVVSGLVALPLSAHTLNLDTFDTITCLNHSTGQAVVGSLQNGAVSCSGLQSQDGDHIGIVLSGGSGDGGGGGSPCQQVREQEPNDREFQEVGTLASGTCMSFEGSIHTGYGDPNNPTQGYDNDNYLITPQGISSVQLAVEASGQVALDVYDPYTGESLACQGDVCTIPAGLDAVGLWIAAPAATSYRVQVQAGGSGTGPGFQGMSEVGNHVQVNSGLRRQLN